jgi:glycosyltransferase involved in cell wall biosynthesis
MMNVLWLASWYPNTTNPFDGDFIERHAKAVSRFVNLTVIFIAKDSSLPKGKFIVEKEAGCNLTVYKGYYGLSSSNKLLEKLISYWAYKKFQTKIYNQVIAEQGKPDIVHAQVAMKAGLLAFYLKKRYQIPFLITEHWSGYYKYCTPNVYSGNWLLNSLNKKVLRQAALLITVSDHLGKTINEDFVAAPYKTITNVVDTRLFFYCPATSQRFRFIHPSGMVPVKNPEGILAACGMVKEKGYDFELLMLGAEDNKLSSLAEQLGVFNSHVFFRGIVSYAEVAKQMQQSSALLMFSRHENMSCVVLEALCCGLPVIGTRVGGMPEVVTDANGLLVESENILQLADAMCKMIDSYHCYNRKAIAAAAEAIFNYDTVGKQHEAIYKNIIASVFGLALIFLPKIFLFLSPHLPHHPI